MVKNMGPTRWLLYPNLCYIEVCYKETALCISVTLFSGYSKGYKYNPAFSGPVEQEYFPEELKGTNFFK